VPDMLYKGSRVAREQQDIAKTTIGPSRAKNSNIRFLNPLVDTLAVHCSIVRKLRNIHALIQMHYLRY